MKQLKLSKARKLSIVTAVALVVNYSQPFKIEREEPTYVREFKKDKPKDKKKKPKNQVQGYQEVYLNFLISTVSCNVTLKGENMTNQEISEKIKDLEGKIDTLKTEKTTIDVKLSQAKEKKLELEAEIKEVFGTTDLGELEKIREAFIKELAEIQL